jgi:very-short-patch-repair endonuclease
MTARRLRQNATKAEILLWRRLKQLETRGTHFRRQMPIGNFVVDFACPAAYLIVEADGSQHGEDDGRRRDRTRTRSLESEGYRVIRFWNNEITQNIQGVMEAIYANIYGSLESEPYVLKHARHRGTAHPTPARRARRPSRSRGG